MLPTKLLVPGPLSFLNTTFSPIQLPHIGVEGVIPIPATIFDSLALFYDLSATPSRTICLYLPDV